MQDRQDIVVTIQTRGAKRRKRMITGLAMLAIVNVPSPAVIIIMQPWVAAASSSASPHTAPRTVSEAGTPTATPLDWW